jgi:hypothetical protein
MMKIMKRLLLVIILLILLLIEAGCSSSEESTPTRGSTALYGAAVGWAAAAALGGNGPVQALAALGGVGLGYILGSDPDPCYTRTETDTDTPIINGNAAAGPTGNQHQRTICNVGHSSAIQAHVVPPTSVMGKGGVTTSPPAVDPIAWREKRQSERPPPPHHHIRPYRYTTIYGIR